MTSQTPPPQGQWSDREITGSKQDRFATQDYANVLANRAATADTPLTIGVFGRWGSGKTSLMKLVDESLQGREKSVKTIWVNVWQLSTREELWSAFLQALLTGVRERLPWHSRWRYNWKLFWDRVKWWGLMRTLLVNSYRVVIAITPILLSALWPDDNLQTSNDLLRLIVDPVTGGIATTILAIWIVIAPAIEAAREKVSIDVDFMLKKSPYEVQISELQKLQNQFYTLVETWVGKEGRLIIFVDDLDRCTPDKIPEVLEAIKLFTNTKKCVYIIGLDHKIVQDGIKTKYKFNGDAEAEEYLDKVIQIPFHIPPLDEVRISRYVGTEYQDVVSICQTAPEVFSKGLEPNPRKVKRVLNIYRTLWELAEARENVWEMDPVDPELLAKMVVIQNRYRNLYDQIVRHLHLLFKLEGWARLITHPDDFDPLIDTSNEDSYKEEIIERTELHENFDTLVLEGERVALANMLEAGKERFQRVPVSKLSSYIYLTGTLEGGSGLTRPSRQEREALLSNDRKLIREQVSLILERGKTDDEKLKTAFSYIQKLDAISMERRKNIKAIERHSADYALVLFEAFLQKVDHIALTARADYFMLLDENTSEINYLRLWTMLDDMNRQDSTELEAINFMLDSIEFSSERLDLEPEMVRVPAGRFIMGTGDEDAVSASNGGRFQDRVEWEKPNHQIELSSYLIGKYPITNNQYQLFIEETHHPFPKHWKEGKFPAGKDAHPVVNVFWKDAIAYCEWLSNKTGKSFRLPTEAEWEKAARGTDSRLYPWGYDWSNGRCNSTESNIGDTTEVGYYSPLGDSPYGCADMAGNVWEWCSDWFDEKEYEQRKGQTVKNPQGPEEGSDRVVRGGSFYNDKNRVASSARGGDGGDIGDSYGFRVVVSPGSL